MIGLVNLGEGFVNLVLALLRNTRVSLTVWTLQHSAGQALWQWVTHL